MRLYDTRGKSHKPRRREDALMGYHRHHAIVVTSWKDEAIEAAHAEATRVFEDTHPEVTAITPAVMNGFRSFLVAPDGSKEGWADSDRADAAREQFVAWLRDPPEGVYVEWAEVNFGGDDAHMIGVRGVHGRLWGEADDDA